LKTAVLLRIFNNRWPDAVLDRPAGIEELDLGGDDAVEVSGYGIEPDLWCAADCFNNTVVDFHFSFVELQLIEVQLF
jgi:hypothetical protein